MMRLEQEIMARVRPSDELDREVQQATVSLLSLVRSETKDVPGVVDVKVVGSVAKRTYVSKPDLDIFILFDDKTARNEMDKIGLRVGHKLLSPNEERYAEHPYVFGIFQGFEADIVPCYQIKDTSKLLSAVDRTPFHTDYVTAELKPGQRDEVRALKQFLKGIGAYGAEAKVQGFSGYLTELLILKYGDFRSVIEKATDWKYGTRLDLEGKGNAKFDNPLIFYDPIDNKRNVASALSLDNFCLFIHACKEYLKSPRESFFFPLERNQLSKKELEEKLALLGQRIIVVKAPRPEIIDDNLYPQIRKTLEGIVAALEHEGFKIADRSMHVNSTSVHLGYLAEQDSLSEFKKHVGPPMWMENANDFLEKWREASIHGPYLENGRWVVYIRRKCSTAKQVIEVGLTDASVGSSFKGVDFQVMDQEEAFEQGELAVISLMLDKRDPWD